MKTVLVKEGLPTPRWMVVSGDAFPDAYAELRFPVVVKPDCGSESVGVMRVDEPAALTAAFRRVSDTVGFCPILVEEWMREREFSVAVIGNGTDRQGLPLEVVLPQGQAFLTAEVKLHMLAQTPAPVTDSDTRKRLGDLAMAACSTLEVEDWGRVDVLEDAAGDLYVIDVNTLPGLRRRPEHISYFPLCLGYGGLDYAESILALVGVSLLRHGIALPPSVKAAYRKLLRDWPPDGSSG